MSTNSAPTPREGLWAKLGVVVAAIGIIVPLLTNTCHGSSDKNVIDTKMEKQNWKGPKKHPH